MLQLLTVCGLDLKAIGPPSVPYPDSILYLVEQGVPLNARDTQGHTPLYEWLPTLIESWLLTDPDLAKSREHRRSIEQLLRESSAQL